MENNSEVLKNNFRQEFGKTTATIECNIDSTEKGGVARLLSVSAVVKKVMVDKNGDSAKVSATLNCKVVFLNKDSQFDSFDYLCDFTANVNCDMSNIQLQKFENLWAECQVMDIDSSVVGDIIKTQSVVNIAVFGIYEQECTIANNFSEQCICKTKTLNIQKLQGLKNYSFDMEEDFSIGCTVDKILYHDAYAVVEDVQINDSSCLVSGNICGALTYLSEGIVTVKNFNSPFAEQINIDGLLQDDKVLARANVEDIKIVLTGVEGDNVILLQIKTNINCVCFKEEEKSIVSDCFCNDCELVLQKENKCFCSFEKQFNFGDKIVGSAEINEEMMQCNKIISTTLSRNTIANTYCEQGKIVVEGVLASNVVYQDIEENNQSILIEMPYSLSFGENIKPFEKLFASAVVENMYAKLKRDREFEVTISINVCITACKEQNVGVVTALEYGEKKTSQKSALTIYICKPNDTLWDIAKALGTSEENVLLQNSDLQDDFVGKKVLYYRQINC